MHVALPRKVEHVVLCLNIVPKVYCAVAQCCLCQLLDDIHGKATPLALLAILL
jgi:hypothetical protein